MSLRTITVDPYDPYNFTGPTRELAGPVRTGSITPGTPYGEFARWIYVGTTGNLSYIKWDGTTQVLIAIQAGIWHRIHSIGVNSSGTTASNLVWGS